MQTIKGLIALLFIAAVVFAIGATDDIKSQDKYAAKLRNSATAETAGRAIAAGRRAATKIGTNAVHQARQKIKNANL